MMTFVRLSRGNASFDEMWARWSAICDVYRENFADFSPAALGELERLASEPPAAHAGVYALKGGDGEYLAVCQLNAAFLPGYEGKVLRLRHLVLNPAFEYSVEDMTSDYVRVLTEVFTGVVEVAEVGMPAEHIKIHLRSPGDRQFFNHFEVALKRSQVFASVQLQGAWLYITKR